MELFLIDRRRVLLLRGLTFGEERHYYAAAAKICIFPMTVTKLCTQTAMVDLYFKFFLYKPLKDTPFRT